MVTAGVTLVVSEVDAVNVGETTDDWLISNSKSVNQFIKISFPTFLIGNRAMLHCQ